MTHSAAIGSQQARQPLRETGNIPELVAVALIFLAFVPTLVSFPPMWIDKGGQGFVAAGFAFYLTWRDRKTLFPEGQPIAEASLLIAGLSALWLVAYILNVQVVHQASLPLVLLGWLLAVRGIPAVLAMLPIAGVFFLAVPIWGALIRPLQTATVDANGLLLKLSGIKAVIEGDYIRITSGTFVVAEGCAGVNYFETGLLIGTMYSMLFLVTWRGRAMAVAIALSLAIVSNWLRVFGLIVIGEMTEMQSPLIADHGMYGWLIFAGVMALFFVIMKRVEQYDAALAKELAARPTTPTKTPDRIRAGVSDGSRTWQRRLIFPTLAAVVGPLAFVLLGGRSATGAAPAEPLGIAANGDWVVSEPGNVAADASPETATADSSRETAAPDSIVARRTLKFDSWRPKFAGADEYRSKRYQNGETQVRVDRALYSDQRQGRELVTSTNRVTDSQYELKSDVIGPIDQTGRLLNSTISRTDRGVMLTWYWYSVGGFITHSSTRAKLMELIAFAKASSPPAELVAVSALCDATNCDEASKSLYKLVVGREVPASAP